MIIAAAYITMHQTCLLSSNEASKYR